MNWEQLKTILWLRWRLTLNQWRRSGGLGAFLAAIVAVGSVVLGGVSFVGALLGAAFGLGEAKPVVIMGIWFGLTAGFLFFWLIGLLAEIQRSETIDLQRLLHLPVALGQMFAVNYLASHLTLSLILVVPAMTGLAIGLAFARGPAMLLLLPLAWGMVFMITAWTYCLRGWLAELMTNPRRRQTVIMSITVGFVLLGQLPNFYFNVLRQSPKPQPPGTITAEDAQRQREARQTAEQQKLAQMLELQKFIPLLWLPLGAQRLAEHQVLPALFGTLGCVGIGALGLRRAYRGTLRFYQGDPGANGARNPANSALRTTPCTASTPNSRDNFLELRPPWIPEQAAAVALATIRSMLRAPEVKMAWAMPYLIMVIMGSSLLWRSTPPLPEAAKPPLLTGALAFSLFMMVQFLSNQFGFDRDGFRAFVLSPADRRLILLGKNLATWPFNGLFGLMLIAFFAVWLQLPTVAILAAVFQLITLLLLASLVGNLLSILVPFRMAVGKVAPTKIPARAMLMMVLCQLFFPLVMLPVFIPPLLEWLWQFANWPAGVPVNLLLSMLLATLTTWGYWQALNPLGRLLHRRETKILNTVAAEVE